jgi:hypothetical protein
LTNAERIWIPWFLLERRVGSYVQALYDAIVGAHENARNLLAFEPSMEVSAAGSDLTRNRFHEVMWWLSNLRECSVSDDVFVKQALEPARCAARFKIKMDSMTDIVGVIFSKSKNHYDPFFDDEVCTLSLVVPSLECSMSIKCRKDASCDLTYGTFELIGVQPLPYVNRIHPVRPSLHRIADNSSQTLGNLDFLKVAVPDLKLFSRSLALENYCEIESAHFHEKRRLGATCIVSGRLVSAAMPRLILQSPSDPAASEPLLAASQLLRNMNCNSGDVESLEGQNVRVLCSAWYTSGREERCQEAFYIELVDDPCEIIWDEIVGKVRLYGRYPIQSVECLFQNSIQRSEIPQVLNLEANGTLRWAPRKSGPSRMVNMFLEEMDHLKQLRGFLEKEGASHVAFERRRILDHAKLQRSSILKNEALMECFGNLISRQDFRGIVGKSYSSLIRSFDIRDQEIFSERLRWLRNCGLLKKTKSGIQITERGSEIAYLTRGESIRRIVRESLLAHGNGWIFLHELSKLAGTSRSLSLRALRELEDEWLHCLTLGGKRYENVWVVGLRDDIEKTVNAMERRILAVLRDFSFSVGTSRILEKLRSEEITHDTLVLMLCEMKRQSILTEPEHGMWWYPWEQRILGILSEPPHPVLDTDELMSASSYPKLSAEKWGFLAILERLEDMKKIVKWEKKWAINSSDELARRDQVRWILRDDCRKYMLSCIRRERWMEREQLLSETMLFLKEKIEPFGRYDGLDRELFENALRELQQAGELAVTGTMVKLIGNS